MIYDDLSRGSPKVAAERGENNLVFSHSFVFFVVLFSCFIIDSLSLLDEKQRNIRKRIGEEINREIRGKGTRCGGAEESHFTWRAKRCHRGRTG